MLSALEDCVLACVVAAAGEAKLNRITDRWDPTVGLTLSAEGPPRGVVAEPVVLVVGGLVAPAPELVVFELAAQPARAATSETRAASVSPVRARRLIAPSRRRSPDARSADTVHEGVKLRLGPGHDGLAMGEQ